MTDQTKKPKEDQLESDALKKASENVARAAESRERVSEVLEKHRGEIRQIINLLARLDPGLEKLKQALLIKQTLPAEIDLRQFPGYMEAVRAGFLANLWKGQANVAIEIRDLFGEGIDFTEAEGYGEAVRSIFLVCLYHGMIERAIKIRDELGEGIDFTEESKSGFLECLREGQIDTVLIIRDKLGQGIDFTKAEGYEEAVRSSFLASLQKGRTEDAIKIRDEFGEGIDLAGEIRSYFFGTLQEGDIDNALKIRKELGQGIDFTEEIKSHFLYWLRKNAGVAIYFRDKLGQGIDFTEEIRSFFLYFLREGKVDKAIEIRRELGQGIDFRRDSEYKPAFSAFCEKHYPDFGDYLASKEADESLMKKYKNEFWVKAQNISQELLLRFESLVVFADGFMRKAMKDKIRSYGVDPERPDWGEMLTEGQKGEIGAFMDNLQTQIRAKIQTIASPELIRAYMDRNEGGMGWMEAA